MKNIDYEGLIIIFNAMSIPFVYMMRLDYILYQEKWKKTINNITSALIIAGMVVALFIACNSSFIVISVSCLFPKYHLWLYRVLRKFFVKKMKRGPIDMTLNFKSGYTEDRIFAIFFLLFAIFSAAAIWAPLVALNSNV